MSYWTIKRQIKKSVQKHINDLSEERNVSDGGLNQQAQIFDDENPPCINSPPVTENAPDVLTPAFFPSESQVRSNIDFERIFDNEGQNDNSDSKDDSSELSDAEDIPSKLQKWAVQHKITASAISELLLVLHPVLPELPKDPRTFLKTNVNYSEKILEICGGKYFHFGIQNGIEKKLVLNYPCTSFQAELQINIDGLPLFKSSNHQFWPILGRVVNSVNDKPFVIGLFSGTSKPNNLEDFLEMFVNEYRHLCNSEFLVKNTKVCVHVHSVICDAPARAFVKNVKQYSAYHGCDKCTQSGVWLNKITYPSVNASLRTDQSFNDMLDEDHHKGVSPLSTVGVGMVSQFPCDYMHMVCLGVMRRLLFLWTKGPLTVRIGGHCIEEISNLLLSFKNFVPCEFARKPRSLKELERWKATELRQFLLYTGPVALSKTLHSNVYDNFMLLSVSMHILLNENLSREYSQYAHDLLVVFVQHFGKLYGPDMLVYNVHGLIHLPNDAEKFGSLDSISSFPFENFLKSLKRLVRKPSFPLAQVIRRLSEENECDDFPLKSIKLMQEHNLGPIPDGYFGSKQFKVVHTSSYVLKLNEADSFIKIHGHFGRIENILYFAENIYLVYKKFIALQNFFKVPLDSGLLGIFKSEGLAERALYTVVEFLDEKEVAVVPTTWLKGAGTCLWPSWRSTQKCTKAVKTLSMPNDDFLSYKIKVLCDADSYEKALQKCRRAEDTSDIATDEEMLPLKKRVVIPNTKYLSYSDDSSSPSKSPRKTIRNRRTALPDLPTLPSPPFLNSEKPPSLPRESSERRVDNASPRPSTLLEKQCNSGINKNISATEQKLINIVEDMRFTVHAKLNVINKNVEGIMAFLSSKDNAEQFDRPNDIRLPLNTLEEMKEMEEKLREEDFFTKILGYLGMIGGNSLQATVHSVLSALMTTNVAVQYNWKGKGVKHSFEELLLKGLVIKAVRRNKICCNAMNAEIENIIKSWLKYAADRDGGRTVRQRLIFTVSALMVH